MIPFFDYTRVYKPLNKQITEKINNVIESGRFINGPEVKLFEDEVSNFLTVKHAVGVSSGTDALTMALMSSLENKGIVLCPSFTFIATAMSALRLGHKVKFVDLEKGLYRPSIESYIEACCEETVAIIWVHLFGESTDLSRLYEFCKSKNIVLIEDCAQSFGSRTSEKHTGTQSDFGCFSFFPTKNLGGFGDGGMVVTNNDEYYENLKKVKTHGCSKKYFSETQGGNFRLDTIQASILSVILKSFHSQISQRRRNADVYLRKINNNKITLPKKTTGHTWNQFSILVDDNQSAKKYFSKNGVSSMIYYPYPLHQNPVFNSEQNLKNTEDVCRRVISLPIYPGLKMEEIEKIIKVANEY